MGNRITQNGPFLRFLLSDAPLKQRKSLLSLASKGQVRALSEIAYNLLKDTIEISVDQRKGLEKYKNIYRTLGCNTRSIGERKGVLRKNDKAISLMLRLFRSHLQL